MKVFYLETSAILQWLLNQNQAKQIRALIDQAELILSSRLTLIELQRSLIRLETSQEISAAMRHQLQGLITNFASTWTMMEMSQEVQQLAVQKFPIEPVRTLDALHLATILTFLQVYPELEVLSCDRRILENLHPLGLRIVQTHFE